jgi:energy-coupling factor transport system ATP-binding protein
VNLIELKQLTYRYPDATVAAISDVSLTFHPGEWVLFQGPTGSGKSTLLRAIAGLCPAFHGGTIRGQVFVNGQSVEKMTAAERVHTFGFVGQDPEAQNVYSTAAREVAFALENLGVPAEEMEWRVAEALDVVGLSAAADRPVTQLSGGERQRLALAAALVHQPVVLLLDEPTSQLDPVASEDWFDILRRLNEELGITILMSEHRLDRAYRDVHRVIYLEGGRVLCDDTPRNTARWLHEHQPEAVPTLARLRDVSRTASFMESLTTSQTASQTALSTASLTESSTMPLTANGSDTIEVDTVCLTVREARSWLARRAPSGRMQETPGEPSDDAQQKAPLLSLKGITCAYPDLNRFALDECTLSIPEGSITAVIGPNGAGKSTLLRVLAGLQAVQEGVFGGLLLEGEAKRKRAPKVGDPRIGYLPQNPNDMFSQESVERELYFSLQLRGSRGKTADERVESALKAFDLSHLRHRYPRDVSGGERLRVALACLLIVEPELLLLDEPTRGFDPIQKRALGEMLKGSARTIVIATHDMDFVAEFAHRVVFLHQGRVVLEGTPKQVFQKALYFAPAIARAARLLHPGVVSLTDAIKAGWAT